MKKNKNNNNNNLKIRVTPIDEKMRESCLRLFSHEQRIAINAPMRKSDSIQVKGTKRGIGRPKIILEVVKMKIN